VREGENDGVDYNFITRARFEEMIAAGAFLEWADVFGNLYGTSAADVARERAAGRDLVLVIDVQGARQVRARVRDAVSVFIAPPSDEALRTRLVGRGSDSLEQIERRLETAWRELAARDEFDHVVVNDDLDAAVEELSSLVASIYGP
jgi:guanylate kinase